MKYDSDIKFHEFLRENFRLNDNGELLRYNRTKKAWVPTTNKRRYVLMRISYNGGYCNLAKHRIVWFLSKGEFPKAPVTFLNMSGPCVPENLKYFYRPENIAAQ